jgi:uncharacterized protein YcaQ
MTRAASTTRSVRVVTPEEAADALVTHLGLRRMRTGPKEHELPDLLDTLRHIQLDPLDVLGTNADLVAMARIEGLKKGDVYRHLLSGHAFEHFAKERCLLPRRAFPWYRRHITQTRWWGLEVRLDRLPAETIEAVLETLTRVGPATSAELEAAMREEGMEPGRVTPLDWSGWKGTSKAVSMALEVLWTRCDAVVVGRRGRSQKVFDVAARAFGRQRPAPKERERFLEWALLERVHAAKLLGRHSGPHWSTISELRDSELPDRLVARGELEEVQVAGSPRRYLAPAGLFEGHDHDGDEHMRILGPLDPMLWDRKLVHHAFGFDYVWEVYKPAHTRRFGYYVLPLLHHGRLVGRFEGHLEDLGQGRRLVVDTLWKEDGRRFDQRAFKRALARHEAALSDP